MEFNYPLVAFVARAAIALFVSLILVRIIHARHYFQLQNLRSEQTTCDIYPPFVLLLKIHQKIVISNVIAKQNSNK